MKKQRKGFTLIELLIVVVIVGILALAAIPLITSNTRDARRAEGEQMLGSMKNQARVAFAEVGMPAQLTGPVDGTPVGCNVDSAELQGKYFTIADSVGGTSTAATIATGSAVNSGDGTGTITFPMAGGAGSFTWS